MPLIKKSKANPNLGKYSRWAGGGDFCVPPKQTPRAETLAPATDDALGTCPKIGLLAGQCRISEDFDAPLPDFEKDYFGE